MGKITVVVSDTVEERLRKLAFDRTGGKKGTLSEIVEEALEVYVANPPFSKSKKKKKSK